MRRAVRAALASVAASIGAACRGSLEPADQVGPIVSLTPTEFFFAVGDSSTLTVNSSREGRVRWVSTNPAVVSVDSAVSTNDPARVRARAIGTALLNGVITIEGKSVATSVPVRVAGG